MGRLRNKRRVTPAGVNMNYLDGIDIQEHNFIAFVGGMET